MLAVKERAGGWMFTFNETMARLLRRPANEVIVRSDADFSNMPC